MAQADYIISNQTFPNTRADLNNHLEAIATNNSGTSAPTTQYAGQWWIDTTTTTWTLYIHDGTDDIQFATIDTSANTVNFVDSALDVVTDTTPQLGGNLDLNSNDITGTGNINITGTLTADGLSLGDNETINLGASNDLQIKHTGTNSLIADTGTGNLIVRANDLRLQSYALENNYLQADEGGEVRLYHNNSEKLNTTSTGIDVTGTVTADGAEISSASSGVTPNANADELFVEGSGNAGITIGSGSSSHGSLRFGDSGNASAGMVLYDHTGNYLEFYTNGLGRTKIDSSGNVGIGTSSPSSPLHIAKSGTGIWFQTERTDAGGFFTISHNSQKTYFNTEQDYIWSMNGTEAMRIDSSGNVGIGTSSPECTLHVQGSQFKVKHSTSLFLTLEAGSSSYQNVLEFSDGGAAGAFTYDHSSNYLATKVNGSEAMRIDSSGRLLVGTTSTTINTSNFGFVFDASTDVFKTSRNTNGGGTSAEHFGNAGQIRFMGDGDAENTNNSYGAISDRTLKENETSANSQWNDIKALQIKNYNLIEYPDRPQIGVIAQDLEDAGMNGLVKTNDDGLKSVKYSVLYMKAVKALQEALIEIDNLKARVDTLEGN